MMFFFVSYQSNISLMLSCLLQSILGGFGIVTFGKLHVQNGFPYSTNRNYRQFNQNFFTIPWISYDHSSWVNSLDCNKVTVVFFMLSDFGKLVFNWKGWRYNLKTITWFTSPRYMLFSLCFEFIKYWVHLLLLMLVCRISFQTGIVASSFMIMIIYGDTLHEPSYIVYYSCHYMCCMWKSMMISSVYLSISSNAYVKRRSNITS